MVTRDTPWPGGTPCWADIGVRDIPRAAAFYQGLFGWDIQSGGSETGGYSIAHYGGRIVAAIGPKMGPAEVPAAWTTYLATDDADATAEAIKRAGGQLVVAPMDVLGEGRMAIAMDPSGALFGLWQAGRTTGIGLANEPGALCWNEHLSDDLDASKAFYHAVFGYDFQDLAPSYAMLMLGDDEVGAIGALPEKTLPEKTLPEKTLPEGERPGWGVYFGTADADASAAEVSRLGGAVVRPPYDSDYGRICVVADVDGAVFKLITPAQSDG